jgi:hypothetical protein
VESRDVLQKAALELVIGVVVTLGFALLAVAVGSRIGPSTQQDPAHRKFVLRYGGMYIGGMALGSVFSIGVLVIVVFVADNIPPRDQWFVVAVFGAMAAGCNGLLVEGYRRRVTLDDDGIAVRGWLGGERRVAWTDVVRVENKVASSKFVVRTLASYVSLSHFLGGLDWFTAECRARLAPEVYGEELEKPLNRYMGF